MATKPKKTTGSGRFAGNAPIDTDSGRVPQGNNDNGGEIVTQTTSNTHTTPINVSGDTITSIKKAIEDVIEEKGLLSEKAFDISSKFPHLINRFGGVNCAGSQVELLESSENALVARIESSVIDAVAEAFSKIDLTDISKVTGTVNALQGKLDAISTSAGSASTEAVAVGDKVSALTREVTALAKLVKELKTTSSGYTGLTSADEAIIESATENAITRANTNQTNTIVSRVTDSVRSIVTSGASSAGATTSSLLSGFMSFNWVIAIVALVLGAVSVFGLVFGIVAMAFPIIQGLISSSRLGKGLRIFLHILNALFLITMLIFCIGMYGSLINI
ncbi:MAG: hypothetical protein IKA43_02800 [Clostridia bacterium]|nr:hypothetical protein [Clostridia bacterium]